MSINTEAAELLHAVADLYECGALEWVPKYPVGNKLSIVVALRCASLSIAGYDALKAAFDAIENEEPIWIFYWERRKGRNTRHVISLLRKAAQRLEEA